MKTAPSIPLFREINECHEANGFPIRTDLPEFHVFTLAETYPCSRQAMPPYRRGFHQLMLLERVASATMQFEDERLTNSENMLVFSHPDQVLSWICGGSEQGYMLYFKAELLAAREKSVEELFPFFEPTAFPLVQLSREELGRLQVQFAQLHEAGRSAHPYRVSRLAALTMALLYDCRAIYERQSIDTAVSASSSGLVARFRQMLAECFQHHCSVESYAECLHVSPDHLRAVVKKHTGRTVRDLINERVMLEAKRLLSQTALTVAEVAWHLQFSEPTHFTRFFKRNAGCTPVDYRRGTEQRLRSAA